MIMAVKTLISPIEVIDKGHFEHNYDSKLLCSHISIAEEKFLKSADACFGEKLYNLLLNDVINFQDYDNGITYSIGDYIIYEGKFYKCIQSSLSILPGDNTYWLTVGKLYGMNI